MSFDNLNTLSQQEVDNASTPSPKKSATLARQRSASFDNLASLQADEAGKGQAQAQAAGVKKGLKGLEENEAIARAEQVKEPPPSPGEWGCCGLLPGACLVAPHHTLGRGGERPVPS